MYSFLAPMSRLL